MSQSSISTDLEGILRNTIIASESPGSILHDFQVMLDFVAEESPQLTPAKMLPMKVLAPLNQQLSRRAHFAYYRIGR